MRMDNFIVTIDGPAGAGKTTVAREVGLRLNWLVLESGMLYRAVASILMARGGEGVDRNAMIEAARMAEGLLRFSRMPDGRTQVFIGDKPASHELRTPEVERLASLLATDQEVRNILLLMQRSLLKQERFLIAEGRDMGTRVFPEADVKFFLTASIEVRTARRARELEASGIETNEDEIARQIRERDERDETREADPLKPAEDAIVIDTSRMNVREVVSEILEIVSPRVRERQERELYESRYRV